MRPVWFSTKVAVWFSLVLGAVVLATLWLLMFLVGRHLVEELGRLRAYDGVDVAETLESLPESESLEAPAVDELLRRESQARGVVFSLRAPTAEVHGDPASLHGWFLDRHSHRVEVRGRECRILGAPAFETWVPVFREGREIARLVVGGSPQSYTLRAALHSGLLWIGLLTLLGVIVLSVLLTAPLRRMSRSMDRIAAGDLAHRVRVRGGDEVAAMGRSFNAMADRIREMVLGQKELMAGVSHELRSPLARMKVGLELLREEPSDRRLQELEGEIDEIDALVGELLLVSRFDLGAVPLRPEVLDLEELCIEAWKRVEERARKRGTVLETSWGEGGREVRADRSLVVRILGNLFENAARYSHPGTVYLRSDPAADDRVRISFEDSGPGVEPAQ
ncbi:MAG: HAMP domain-containing histidine kinase, partial [Acidobacteria bacterium]|nr:HAMP domain-containing histidine kinase [Acidobacteriota bacterium]